MTAPTMWVVAVLAAALLALGVTSQPGADQPQTSPDVMEIVN